SVSTAATAATAQPPKIRPATYWSRPMTPAPPNATTAPNQAFLPQATTLGLSVAFPPAYNAVPSTAPSVPSPGSTGCTSAVTLAMSSCGVMPARSSFLLLRPRPGPGRAAGAPDADAGRALAGAVASARTRRVLSPPGSTRLRPRRQEPADRERATRRRPGGRPAGEEAPGVPRPRRGRAGGGTGGRPAERGDPRDDGRPQRR